MTGGRMHPDEISTDVALVRRLLAEQFPKWAALPITPVPSAGTDTAMYRLGDEMAVRLPRIGWAVAAVEHEQRWLPWLAPRLPVALPAPLGVGAPGAGYPYPWSVYRWLDGVNPVVGQLPDPHALALELASFVAALHRIDSANGPPSGQTLLQKDAFVRSSLAALAERMDTAPLRAAWEAALRTPAWDGAPTWIHGDLAGGNVLLVGGRLSAVIDFSGVGVGDPSDDLRIAWNLLPTHVRGVFRDALAVDEAAWARGRGRALAQAIVQLPYYWDTNPALAANARHVIREVLGEHNNA